MKIMIGSIVLSHRFYRSHSSISHVQSIQRQLVETQDDLSGALEKIRSLTQKSQLITSHLDLWTRIERVQPNDTAMPRLLYAKGL